MSVTIPCQTALTHYDMRVPLDGATYLLEFRWSIREACWYLDLRDEQEDPIYLGMKVLPNVNLLFRCVDERCPPGVLAAVDTTGAGDPPGIDDLGGRVQVLYFPAAELDVFTASSGA